MERTAKLFMNGRSQAVRLPSEFRFEGDEVSISKDPLTGGVLLTSKDKNFDEFFRMRDALTQSERDEFVIPRDRSPVRVPKLVK
ncbi:SpoVT / AbrB-like protein [Terriglobus roseus DSM 18391]|uniref:SpoVT / AbrB-like protein n=1 Tax=Terriglobus roseus (strain DSM 18391 / NRRL B-41598 / KBS 63) TaxID=926566 RepID=I3ZKS2_TERRK|nr:AbrB/MazE/SpoVT family DNA-binding domain-containing protein [Terriglobus roseus]AFL89840.1 SpoVT / AbrB-like protein [Terriglobus roseus DSM 18391]